MVAKSYQKMTILDEPFLMKGRMYVKVKNENTGTERTVRWYTEAEYKKMYPDSPFVETEARKSQREALGFQEGYITIFKGDTYANLEWFQRSIARYARWWGWYVVSTDTLPFDLPIGLEPIQLPWEMVGDSDGVLYDEKRVRQAVDSLLYDRSNSSFQGAIGGRLELRLTVIKAFTRDSYYGKSTTHIMTDDCGNQYVWTTTSKSWEEGKVVNVRGTVKEHKVYKNVETTYLTRCMEVKK